MSTAHAQSAALDGFAFGPLDLEFLGLGPDEGIVKTFTRQFSKIIGL